MTLHEDLPRELTAEEGSVSILFRRPIPILQVAPDYFGDLGLDRVAAALVTGREDFHLGRIFATPLRDDDDVRFRQAAYRDVTAHPAPFTAFAERMRQMRASRTLAGKVRHPLQAAALGLEAADHYTGAVDDLLAALEEITLSSDALSGFRSALRAYASSDPFATLREDAHAIGAALAAVRYTLALWPGHLTVSPDADLPELIGEVESTFERFQQGQVKDYRVEIATYLEMNHVETAILDRVELLHPEPFARLREFMTRTATWFPAELLTTFDQALAFYLGYDELTAPLRERGMRFTMPVLSADPRVHATGTFDLALALKLSADGDDISVNDIALDPPERFLVITGPNQGGKTTYARMFGALHHVAALGLPVPGAGVTLGLPDRIFTHFEREEDAHSGHGKLEDELLRVRRIIDLATDRSVVIMNEMFSSTTLADAIDLGTRILDLLIGCGSVGVCVTFVDELTRLGDATVSLVGDAAPDDSGCRTFAFSRRPADGIAHALSIARRHRLSYEQLTARLS